MARSEVAGGSHKRVVVTGMGIVSCLGNDKASVTASLRALKPGISFIPEYAELGMRSQVAGVPEIDLAKWKLDIAGRVEAVGGGDGLRTTWKS